MKIATVYKITSPTGKIYVGSTINKIADRIKNYQKLQCKTQIKIYNSLLKYGFDAHLFEIIETCDIKDRNIRESYWGKFHDVLGEMGLNCVLPKSEIYEGVSEETREKHRNKIFSDQHRENMKKSRANVIYTPERRAKMSASKMGNKSTTGRKGGEYQKQVVSKLHKGKTISEETKAKRKATIALRNGKLTDKEYESRYNQKSAKLVLNTETGIYYNSQKEAGRSSPYSGDKLSSMLNEQSKNRSSYILV